jgi:hypothetical protein
MQTSAEAMAIVREVVHQWDPHGLLGGGAPDNEFDSEIARLAALIPDLHSAADAAQALSSVFSKAFEPDHFTPAQCAQPGSVLFKRLQEAGLVPNAH